MLEYKGVMEVVRDKRIERIEESESLVTRVCEERVLLSLVYNQIQHCLK